MSTLQAPNVLDKPRPRVEQERARRRRRDDVSMDGQKNLSVEGHLDPNYEYRWINDDPGRVYRLTQRDDWDRVTETMLGGRDDRDKGVGAGVERIVGKSDGKKAILVRKPKEFYVEDARQKQARIDEGEAAMKRGETRSPDGLRESDPGKSYVPAGGISFKDGPRG